MAEEKQQEKLEEVHVYGDIGLKNMIIDRFEHVKVGISDGKISLRGAADQLSKVKSCIWKIDIDNYRRQFIITEDYPLQYLNHNLGAEVCYFTKSKVSVSLFIPHNRPQACMKRMRQLVKDRIMVQQYDCNESTTNKKLVENLLFEHFGKIIVVGDAIVYTKDIEESIKAATRENLDVPESQGGGVSDITEFVVDDSCLGFIKKHFPNTKMSIARSRTDIHLSWSKSDFTTGPIKVLDLKLDKRKEQLILTERNTRQYLHRKFESRNILCILAVHINRIYGLVPPNCQNVERVLENVNRVIDESICFKQCDSNDDLSSFNGKCTSLLQDGNSFLVFTDDVRDGVEEMFMRKQGHKDGPNQTSHKANYPKLDKGPMLHQNFTRDRHSSDGKGVLHASNGRPNNKEPDENSSLGSFENNYQETNSYSDNEEELNKGFMASGASNYSELESSFEHMTNLELDTDLSEYIFDSEKFRVKDISSQLGCMIEKENGHIVIGGKNGRKLAEDIYKKAETVAMMSTYIEKNKLDKCSTHSFKELIQKLRMDGSKVALHSCENCRVEYSMVYKGAKVFLIHGSAADIPQTDVLVCPLDSRLNPACASAKHIMTKGGVALRKECLQIATDVTNQQKAFSDFHVQDFQNTGELPAKKLCGIVINQSFSDADTFQRQVASKLKLVIGKKIQKQCFSFTFPLEVGNKVPAAVMARACCVALRELMAEKSSNVKEVFLCVVNEAHLAPVKALIETELRISRDPQRMQANGSLEQCLRKTEIYELPSINVRLVAGSLVDQEVDAIVVPVNNQLDLASGVVSKSVLNAAGQCVQDELKKELPQGIGPMEVAYTGPGRLNLSYILFGNLPKLKSAYGSPASRVNILMKSIFQLVNDLKIQTIALPALGTGGLNYPDEAVAMEIMRAIYLYGPNSGIKEIRVVIYNPMSPQYSIFEKAVEEFQHGVKQTSKACLLHPSIEICREKSNQVFKVTVNGAEQRLCDVEIVNRKAEHVDAKDETPTDSICVKTLEQMSMGLMRRRLFLDLSDTRLERTEAETCGKALEFAIDRCGARFLLINVGRCEPADEAKIIIKKYLKTIIDKLKKEDAVQIHFLVSPESLNACVAYVKEREEKKTSSGWTRRLHVFGRSPEFKWRVVESRIKSQGGYLVICSRDETRLQSALLEINRHISNNEEDEEARPDYDRLDSKRSSNMSLEMSNEDLQRLDRKQLSKSSSASSDNAGNFHDRGSQQDMPMKENNNTGSLRDVQTKDKDGGDLDTQSQLFHKEKKTPYEDTTMVLSKSRLRHLPRKIIEKLKNSLKKIAQCECKGDDIKIKIPYEERHKLLDVLEEPLRGIDKKVYYVRNVTPAIFHLLELHVHVEPDVWVYHEHDEELEIRNYEDIFDEAEEKKKWFNSYQMDSIDVSTNNHLVSGAIQEIHDKKDEKFQNILLEAVNENKVINIHYPVEEQNVVTEMKTLLQVRLKLIKQTGRRKRTFDNYTSLQPNFTTSFNTALDLDTQRETPSVSKDSTHKQHENIHIQKSPTHDSVRLTASTRLSTHLSTYHSMPAYQRSVSVNIPRRTDTDISPDIVAETVYLTAKKMKIRVYKGDILNLNVDCIVNAANEQLMHGGGVAAVIARAAGREFQTESKRYIDDNGPLEVGECVCTGAGRLRYKYVLHAVGPQWGMYKDEVDCEDDLRKTIVNILKVTEMLKVKSVAIPAISSGIFGVPWDVCAQQYAGGLTSFEDESLGTIEEVHFIDIKEDILNEIRNVFNTEFQLQTFNIDEAF